MFKNNWTLCDLLLLYLLCFTFSLSYSRLPFYLVYVFQFLCLFFLMFPLNTLSSIVEKLLYTYKYINSMCNIIYIHTYTLENLSLFKRCYFQTLESRHTYSALECTADLVTRTGNDLQDSYPHKKGKVTESGKDECS